jgi:hypothetical protein
MSGRRPDANKVFSFIGHFREENTGGTNWTALPGYFLEHGYTVAGSGKVRVLNGSGSEIPSLLSC